MSLLPNTVSQALPFVIPAALMSYILLAAFGGTLRQRRKRKAALRHKADPRPPWHRWLDEINRHPDGDKKTGAIEKWRE